MIDFQVQAGAASGANAVGEWGLAGVSFHTATTVFVKTDGSSGVSCGLIMFFDTLESLDRVISIFTAARKGFGK